MLSLQCTVALLTDFPKAIVSSYTLAAILNKPGCTQIYYILTVIVLLNKKNITKKNGCRDVFLKGTSA